MYDEDRQRRFIKLYVESERAIRRLLRVLVWDSANIDDACQTVALRLWDLFDAYDVSRPFDVWAMGVASKVALELNRSKQRAGPVFSTELVAAIIDGFERSPLQGVQSGDQLDALQECLQRLTPRARNLIEKKYLHSIPVEVLAQELGKSVDMTYKLLQQTKRQLAECIRRRLVPQPGFAVISGRNGDD